MHPNKGSKENMGQTLEVCLEFVPSKNWQRRLLQAFEMLIEDKDPRNLTKEVWALKLGHKRREE